MENQTPGQTPQAPTSPVPVLKPVVKTNSKKQNLILSLIALVVVGLGVGVAYLVVRPNLYQSPKTVASKPGAKEAGIADEATFKDSAEGLLEEGGVAGEGTHHLTRSGGVSQTVYLTSTVVNLDDFVGKKVKVFGQTISAKKAGWLMDVGLVKTSE